MPSEKDLAISSVAFHFAHYLFITFHEMNEFYLRIIGGAILGLIAVLAVLVVPPFLELRDTGEPHKGLPPMMALEFLEKPGDVREIIKSKTARDNLIDAVEIDTWRIVPIYTILILLLCAVLFFRTETIFGQFAPYLAVFAILLAFVTAAGDVIENNTTDALLRNLQFDEAGNVKLKSIDQQQINEISQASHIKFAAVFLCAFILSFVFLQFPFVSPAGYLKFFSVISSLIFLLLILCSIVGFIGLKAHFLVYPAMLSLYVAAPLAAFCFLFAPRLYS